jgi:hypothetical protein
MLILYAMEEISMSVIIALRQNLLYLEHVKWKTNSKGSFSYISLVLFENKHLYRFQINGDKKVIFGDETG